MKYEWEWMILLLSGVKERVEVYVVIVVNG